MVIALKGDDAAAVRAGQRFFSEGAWDDAPLRERLHVPVAEALGAPDGVLIVDGNALPEQETHSVGSASQRFRPLGTVANRQEGVFVAHTSAKACAFLDGRFYVPEQWLDATYAPKRTRCEAPFALPSPSALCTRAVECGGAARTLGTS